MIHTPDEIKEVLADKNIENIFFKKYLKTFSGNEVDSAINELNNTISALVDCTKCGNCCKYLEPAIDESDIERLAPLCGKDAITFKQHHVAFDGFTLFMKTKPCLFLSGKTCSIYQQRPIACAGFPHLDGKNFKYKKTLWEHYQLCPIVFNVIEALKIKLNFKYKR